MVSNDLQLNASLSIYLTFLPITTLFNPESWKAATPISITESGMTISFKSEHPMKAKLFILVTVSGTLLGLLVMSMYAYAISRPGFKLSRFLSIYLIIPMLFQGGTLSAYIIFTNAYGLKDSLWLLILPLCVSTMNVIILRTFIANSIPAELMEAAKIDGAGDYRTFFQITLPLMKPSLAAVGFMMATAYWNDWQNAYLYISSDNKKPLQMLLIKIQKSIEFLLNNNNVPASVRAAMGNSIPEYSATMATVIVVIGPIMVAYPFFQKYFIKGLTVGSVKG